MVDQGLGTMRRAPEFWSKKPGILASFLMPLAWIYGAIAAVRMSMKGRKASVPVICVGNLVAGGAGKTPTAIRLAEALILSGKKPVFLSRGYGGNLAGPVLVDPSIHGTMEVGDEPLLLASSAPVIVSRNRARGAVLAATMGDVIMMDDGLQNPMIQKDFSLAVVDAGQGIGNGYCLPVGPLRAPLFAQWPKIDACLIIGEVSDELKGFAKSVPVPLFHGRLRPVARQSIGLNGLKIWAFAGIGRPEKFFNTLEETGALIEERRIFPDHYRYNRSEISDMLVQSKQKLLIPVTTAKDAVKIREIMPEAMEWIRVLEVGLVVDGHEELLAFMMKKII